MLGFITFGGESCAVWGRVRHRTEIDLACERMFAPQSVQAKPIPDSEQPGAEAVLGGERIQRGEGFEKGVLYHLLGVVVVPNHPPNKGEEAILVQIDELAHGVPVPTSGVGHQALLLAPLFGVRFRPIRHNGGLPVHYNSIEYLALQTFEVRIDLPRTIQVPSPDIAVYRVKQVPSIVYARKGWKRNASPSQPESSLSFRAAGNGRHCRACL